MGYPQIDFDLFDYQMYHLKGTKQRVRGPEPLNLSKNKYFICLGAAQTYGRFCSEPYPFLLQKSLKLSSINLSRGGAVPDWFSGNKDFLEYTNNSKFAIIQVMSARTISNSLFKCMLAGPSVIHKKTNTTLTADEAYQNLIQQGDLDVLSRVVSETRQNWVRSYKLLLSKIKVPKILFWFSTREPQYEDNYEKVKFQYQLFKAFPQFVNHDMINQLKSDCDHYVECVSEDGLPQPLINRFTGEPIIEKNKTGVNAKLNSYYPSPEMHENAAKILKPICQKFLEKETESEIIIQEANEMLQKVKLHDALRLYKKAIDLNPEFTDNILSSYISQGNASSKKSNQEDAEKIYKMALEIKPDFFEAYFYLGDLYRNQGKNDLSAIYYIKSAQFNPKNTLVYVRINRLIRSSMLSDETLDKINKFSSDALRASPVNQRVERILLYCLILQKESVHATKLCQKKTMSNNLLLKPDYVKNFWKKGKQQGPDFIVIGFMKCGTTSLYDYMTKHPNILPASQKEIMFFNDEKLFQLGTDWYLSNFPPRIERTEYLTGEASTMYIHQSTIAQRLQEKFPETKIIILLRDPVSRAISNYYFNLGHGVNQHKTLEEIFKKESRVLSDVNDLSTHLEGKSGIIATGLYSYFIKKWMDIFPKEQFLVLNAYDLNNSPQFVMNKVFDFLDLPNYNISDFPKMNSGSYDPINQTLIDNLSDFYRPHNKLLEELLNRKFNW